VKEGFNQTVNRRWLLTALKRSMLAGQLVVATDRFAIGHD
jgi:hypothetical protein